MGYGRTGRSPRRRGGRLPPLMRAWLTPPHGRHHKAPPPPCALIASYNCSTICAIVVGTCTGVACQARRMPIRQPNFGGRENLVISSARCNDPRSSSGFRQTSKRSFNSDETAVVTTRIAVRAPPLATDDDDERTTNDTRRAPIALVYGRSKQAAPPVGGYRSRGVAPAPLARGRRVAVHSSGRPRGAE